VSGNPLFSAVAEGKPLALQQTPTDPPGNPLIGADGITLSPDGKRVFYCPLSSSKLYSVSADALVNMDMSDDQVAQTIVQEDRDFASDDLESDSAGRVYLTDWEHNAIIVRQAPGEYRTLVQDDRLWWPDTLQLTDNGYLYVTATQVHRLRKFNAGEDLRTKPYQLFRIKVDAVPARDTR
jgi:sugar lactone lactonase YvrE